MTTAVNDAGVGFIRPVETVADHEGLLAWVAHLENHPDDKRSLPCDRNDGTARFCERFEQNGEKVVLHCALGLIHPDMDVEREHYGRISNADGVFDNYRAVNESDTNSLFTERMEEYGILEHGSRDYTHEYSPSGRPVFTTLASVANYHDSVKNDGSPHHTMKQVADWVRYKYQERFGRELGPLVTEDS